MSTIPKYRIQIIAFKFEGRFSWLLTSLSGSGGGQGGLACCDSWGHKELDPTERLN